jgi:phosphohistidine phosphatase
MDLYLLRHGVAVRRGTPGYANDRTRPLTPEGRRRLASIALGMLQLGLKFDAIFSSPYVRARETAELVARRLGMDRHVATSPLLAPDADKTRLLSELDTMISRASARVLLVGHEPDLSRLASTLVFGDDGGLIKLRKGGLIKLTVDAWQRGRRAQLEFCLTPEQLRLLGSTTGSHEDLEGL